MLYDLTTLQKEANAQHGFTAEQTLEIAQKLYEKKLITYPRTGSRYIPEDVDVYKRQLKPASFSRYSRSRPIIVPNIAASTRRQTNSHILSLIHI